MGALAKDIHALGLKFGLYSGPWIITYAGYIGCSSDNADGTYDWIKSGDHTEFDRMSKDDKDAHAKRKRPAEVRPVLVRRQGRGAVGSVGGGLPQV